MATPTTNIDRAMTVTLANPSPPTNVVALYQGTPPTPASLAGTTQNSTPDALNAWICADPLNGAARDAVLMNTEDAEALSLKQDDPVNLVNELGRFQGRVFLAPIARGNLQIHWPEGNSIIRRGVTDAASGVPDYNARVRVEKPGA